MDENCYCPWNLLFCYRLFCFRGHHGELCRTRQKRPEGKWKPREKRHNGCSKLHFARNNCFAGNIKQAMASSCWCIRRLADHLFLLDKVDFWTTSRCGFHSSNTHGLLATDPRDVGGGRMQQRMK